MSDDNGKKYVSGMTTYGKNLVKLGEAFQDENTTLESLFHQCFKLGLILSFRVEPAPHSLGDMTVDLDETSR